MGSIIYKQFGSDILGICGAFTRVENSTIFLRSMLLCSSIFHLIFTPFCGQKLSLAGVSLKFVKIRSGMAAAKKAFSKCRVQDWKKEPQVGQKKCLPTVLHSY